MTKSFKVTVNCNHLRINADNKYEAIKQAILETDEVRDSDVDRDFYSVTVMEVES